MIKGKDRMLKLLIDANDGSTGSAGSDLLLYLSSVGVLVFLSGALIRPRGLSGRFFPSFD